MNNFIDLSDNTVEVHAAQGQTHTEPRTENLIDISSENDSQGVRKEPDQVRILDTDNDNETKTEGIASSGISIESDSQNVLEISDAILKGDGETQEVQTVKSSEDPSQPH